MNKYVKEFFHRGLLFGGFGPIVLGIVFCFIQKEIENISGFEIFLGIVSTYLLAFVQAGVTVFNQIEHWSTPKSLFFHFSSLFAAYTICYLGNTWIPFEPKAILVFFAVFVVIYFAVWIAVALSVKAATKKFNAKIK